MTSKRDQAIDAILTVANGLRQWHTASEVHGMLVSAKKAGNFSESTTRQALIWLSHNSRSGWKAATTTARYGRIKGQMIYKLVKADSPEFVTFAEMSAPRD
jgi:hypothetical protein